MGLGAVLVALVAGAFVLGILPNSTAALAVPRYVEEATAAGIDQVYGGDFVASVGGGVAVFDCNDDGRPDLFLAGGSNPAALYRNDGPTGGAFRFSALRDAATGLTGVNGAYPIDIDGDGHTDLAVLRVGESVLLRGLGDCRFERANERWGFDGGNAWATAFSAKWERKDALPTLAVGHYLTLDEAANGIRSCVDNELIRPDPAGTAFGPPTALTPGYCTLSMLFTDWDRSGRRDLRVSNDRQYYDAATGEEQLWQVAPGKPPRLYTAADGWMQVQIWGMGIATYDVTKDGYPDVFLTSQAANRLQTLTDGPGQPTYEDIGLKRGVNATRPFTGGDPLPSTAWHPEFEDVNNDGFIDLFISKGNVDQQVDFASKDPSNLLLGNEDGTFTEHARDAGIVSFAKGRGAALADFNLDGMLDLIEVNFQAPVTLWRNVGSGDAANSHPMGGWLALRVTEPGPNHDAIGAWLEVRVGEVTLQRELTVGGGHISGQLGWVHVGLGPADGAEVRVRWPDGELGPWLQVQSNEFVVIDRASATALQWSPPAP